MKKFWVVIFENSLNDNFFSSDKNLTVWIIKLGSLGFPLKGTGARYGASVSNKILSFGKSLKVFGNSEDFLKVIIFHTQ